MVRGEVFRLPKPRGARGREQRGARCAVVLQADDFADLGRLETGEMRAIDDALELVLGLHPGA